MTIEHHEDESLYAEVERRALFDMPDDEDDERAPDLIGDLTREPSDPAEGSASADMTLGGYVDEHDRVPAFDGIDGQPYTVDVDVEQQPDGTHVAFLIFIRWAATGAGIMDHVESGDIAAGATEEDARRAAMELSLYEIKAELDAAIERRRAAQES